MRLITTEPEGVIQFHVAHFSIFVRRLSGYFPPLGMQAWRKVMAANGRVYDFRYLQAECQEPGSALEFYAR